jgi:hypothetical protein
MGRRPGRLLDMPAAGRIKAGIYSDMAEDFQIDEVQQVIWARCWGVLADQDVLSHQARLRADPRFRPTMAQLVDTRDVTDVTISMDTIKRMGASTLFAAESRRAYVVAQEVMYGLVRMYEIYQNLRGSEGVKVFRSRAEAIAWLGVKDLGQPPSAESQVEAV